MWTINGIFSGSKWVVVLFHRAVNMAHTDTHAQPYLHSRFHLNVYWKFIRIVHWEGIAYDAIFFEWVMEFVFVIVFRMEYGSWQLDLRSNRKQKQNQFVVAVALQKHLTHIKSKLDSVSTYWRCMRCWARIFILYSSQFALCECVKCKWHNLHCKPTE